MDASLRFGILGAARIAGKALVPAMRKVAGVEVAAVSARDGARAAAFAAEHGIARSFEGYQALLDDPGIDAVYVPLPNDDHAEWSVRALQAGKHVLCEKPFAMNGIEARRVADAASQSGCLVMEGFMWRFHPQVALARQALDAGEIGQLRVVRAHFTFVLDRPDDLRWLGPKGGGALYDLGCYCTSAARLFAGREPLSAYAVATRNESGADVSTTAVLDFGQHLTAHFDVSFGVNRQQRVELSGPEGTVTMTAPFTPGLVDTQVIVNGEVRPVAAADSYALMVEHFARAVAGAESLRFPIEDAVKQMAALDAIRESSLSGRPVEVGR